MDEQQKKGDFEYVFRQAVERAIDRRLEEALSGEREWEALQRYVDKRIEQALGKE